MQEEDINLIEKFRVNIIRGMSKEAPVTYETIPTEHKTGWVVDIKLSVGKTVVWSRSYTIRYYSKEELAKIQLKAVGEMLMELPYAYLAVLRKVKDDSELTIEEKAVRGIKLLKEVYGEINTKSVLS